MLIVRAIVFVAFPSAQLFVVVPLPLTSIRTQFTQRNFIDSGHEHDQSSRYIIRFNIEHNLISIKFKMEIITLKLLPITGNIWYVYRRASERVCLCLLTAVHGSIGWCAFIWPSLVCVRSSGRSIGLCAVPIFWINGVLADVFNSNTGDLDLLLGYYSIQPSRCVCMVMGNQIVCFLCASAKTNTK